jgi:hypothetical protein
MQPDESKILRLPSPPAGRAGVAQNDKSTKTYALLLAICDR